MSIGVNVLRRDTRALVDGIDSLGDADVTNYIRMLDVPGEQGTAAARRPRTGQQVMIWGIEARI
jgi:hypothetical protein